VATDPFEREVYMDWGEVGGSGGDGPDRIPEDGASLNIEIFLERLLRPKIEDIIDRISMSHTNRFKAMMKLLKSDNKHKLLQTMSMNISTLLSETVPIRNVD
jgi:hypothetical protein